MQRSFRLPRRAVNFLTSWAAINFSKRTLLPGVSTFIVPIKRFAPATYSPEVKASGACVGDRQHI
jgi:hypothetical protein